METREKRIGNYLFLFLVALFAMAFTGQMPGLNSALGVLALVSGIGLVLEWSKGDDGPNDKP